MFDLLSIVAVVQLRQGIIILPSQGILNMSLFVFNYKQYFSPNKFLFFCIHTDLPLILLEARLAYNAFILSL